MFSRRENQGYYGFNVRFHTRVGESNWIFMFYWLITKHTSAGALIHRQQTTCWISAHTNWIASTDMNLLPFIVPWWNIKRCLQFRRNSNLQLSFWFFYFPVVTHSGEFLASVWQEEGNFEVLKHCYIQIYPECFCCVREKLLFFNVCETWSEVMWSSCKRSSGT